MSDSIGARLRQARELRRLTLQQVSETTKLRPYYLQALENDDHSAIPSAAQARGFLRLYAEFLELDVADLLAGVQPPEPPTAADVGFEPEDTPVLPAQKSLWAGLRERMGRRSKPAPESPPVPSLGQTASMPASTEPATARRPKPDPDSVKKNATK